VAPAAIAAGAVAIGLGLYVLSGVMVLLIARMAAPPVGEGEEDHMMARFHAITVSYTAGWRKGGLALALVAYVCAMIDLAQADASALLWMCAGLAIDCALFLTWRDRAAFLSTLSPRERISDAAGVAALGLALLLTALLRFSGALA
jgi:hypothetical protein